MPELHVFHHNDADGRCGGWVVKHRMEAIGTAWTSTVPIYSDIVFHEVDHGNYKLDPQRFVGKDVVIVDYCFTNEEMERLAIVTREFTWIDHHKTAVERMIPFIADHADTFSKMKGIWDAKYKGKLTAGCALAWMYYTGCVWEDVPEIVKYVSDRDVWVYEFGDRTRLFCCGFYYMADSNPNSNDWTAALLNPDSYIALGEAASKVYHKILGEAGLSCGFWIEWEGYRCFAVNSMFKGSEAWERIAPDAEIYLVFSFNGRFWSVSMYTTNPDIDVSTIAKKYVWNGGLGGGHKGAAGFQCGYPPFLLVGNATYIGGIRDV